MDRSSISQGQLYDVVVVGAGAVGTALAWKLAAEGYRVCVCEQNQSVPESLRLDALSHPVLSLFRELGLLEVLRPVLMPLDSVAHFRNGHLVKGTSEGPYVVSYDRLVESLRPRLVKVATVIWERAVQVSVQGRIKSVRLESGQVVCGWIVVLANGAVQAGGVDPLTEGPVRTICPEYSRTFSWDLEFEDTDRMTHPALVFQTTHSAHGYHALKLFDLGEGRVRANFLTYWSSGDKRRRELLEGDALSVVARTVEGLIPYAGPFRMMSPIEETVADLSQPENPEESGIVSAGDACGATAPSGPLGLRKGLHDVRVLAELMSRWEREARTGSEDLSAYYAHPAKHAIDGETLARSVRDRKVAIDWRPAWATRRLIGDRIPDWVEAAFVGSAVRQSLNLARQSRSGLDS
ncbi:MAG: 2-polyprenyl-6-methoxyphenol hydroxylase/Glycine/D-amino acid oxidase (deaminating) [Verrucomicrobia bacterium]|nr:MAG: 2-polyprenyl-6-methoxyphenol hydroxylase/Glycine/D-amino acid oxidase (deaminating) [Verrucomicrobiota bacterium]